MRSQTRSRRVLKPVALKTGIARVYMSKMPLCNTTDFPVCKPTGSPTWGTHRSEDRNLASINTPSSKWRSGSVVGPYLPFAFLIEAADQLQATFLCIGAGRGVRLRFARVPLGRGPPTATRRRFIFIFRLLTVEIGRGHSHLPNAQEVGWPDGHRSTVRGIAMATPL